MSVCSYEDKITNCERPVYAKGFCHTHNAQKRTSGELSPHRSDIPVDMRFMSMVSIQVGENDCWIWEGYKDSARYGRFRPYGKTVLVHRWAYEFFKKEEIPEGMQVDHLCWNRACVNPEHLRLATPQENSENRKGASSHSKTGIRGVSWHEGNQKYIVQVRTGGIYYYGGYFSDLNEAEQASKDLRNRHHTHNDKDR